MTALPQDLRYVARTLRHGPVFSVSLLLVASTLVSSYLPARQATKVDPMMVMRAE
jgi:ABC-type lipoprotein release transport system permease subunit